MIRAWSLSEGLLKGSETRLKVLVGTCLGTNEMVTMYARRDSTS